MSEFVMFHGYPSERRVFSPFRCKRGIKMNV